MRTSKSDPSVIEAEEANRSRSMVHPSLFPSTLGAGRQKCPGGLVWACHLKAAWSLGYVVFLQVHLLVDCGIPRVCIASSRFVDVSGHQMHIIQQSCGLDILMDLASDTEDNSSLMIGTFVSLVVTLLSNRSLRLQVTPAKGI